jgi:hypothetical protein
MKKTKQIKGINMDIKWTLKFKLKQTYIIMMKIK